MGDETTQFASRFSEAVKLLASFAGDDALAEPPRRRGADLEAAVRRALDAVEAVYGTETRAVRDWPEQRRRVLAQLASLREALDRSGVGDEVRGLTRTLVHLVDPRTAGSGRAGAVRPRRR